MPRGWRNSNSPATALGVLSNDRSHTFRQAVESAAHVRRFAGHPDPRSLRTIHRLQTWQPDHSAASTTTNNARTCSASNPGITIRLRPFCSRTSIHEPPDKLAGTPTLALQRISPTCFPAAVFSTSRNAARTTSALGRTSPLFPLRICSEISLRHFVHAFLFRFRCVIAQLCYATTIFRKMRFTYRSQNYGGASIVDTNNVVQFVVASG